MKGQERTDTADRTKIVEPMFSSFKNRHVQRIGMEAIFSILLVVFFLLDLFCFNVHWRTCYWWKKNEDSCSSVTYFFVLHGIPINLEIKLISIIFNAQLISNKIRKCNK